MLLGCIADDLTGATDLALMLTREGLRTLQTTGLPPEDLDVTSADAVVIALKSRTIAVNAAVAQSLEACDWLRRSGAKRMFFKYCSTFDSTDVGNIGPVAEALLERVGGRFTIACPAFPAAGRSIYMGNLFVNGTPLAESSMRDHPLTPMRDSDLRRVLRRQTSGEVGHVSFHDLEGGPDTIAKGFDREQKAGRRLAVVDALTDRHLRDIGAAAAGLELITGGSGIALGLPAAYLGAGLIDHLQPPPSSIVAPIGRAAILAGSCSAATRAQVTAAIAAGLPAFRVDPLALASGAVSVATILAWVSKCQDAAIPLIYSSDDPANVSSVQARLGRDTAGHLVEDVLAKVGKALSEQGFTRLIIAGGETSGAVVAALGVGVLEIGPEIAPGVPWTLSRSGPRVALALKSGNFGGPDFFLSAWKLLK